MAKIVLTEGNDLYPPEGQHTARNDLIYGLGGSDTILAGEGNNTVYGGSSDDTVRARNSDLALVDSQQIFDGGDGNDLLSDERATNAMDTMYGGAGNDTLVSGGAWGLQAFSDLADGGTFIADCGSGNDSIIVQVGHFTVAGGSGDDLLTLFLSGMQGSVLFDARGPTATYAIAGVQTGTANGVERYILYSGGGDDTLMGGDGADELIGDSGNDLLYGGAGNDRLFGKDGTDTIFGDAGDDYIEDYLYSTLGARLYGGEGNDLIAPNHGDSFVWGGAGNDTVYLAAELDMAANPPDHFGAGPGLDLLSIHLYTFHGQPDGTGTASLMHDHGQYRISGNGALFATAAGFESVTFRSTARNVTLQGGAYDDEFTVLSGTGKIASRGGNDVINVSLPSDGVRSSLLVDGGAGDDSLQLQGYLEPLTLDVARGTFGTATVTGTLRNIEYYDVLLFTGGATLHLSEGDDIVSNFGQSTIGSLLDGLGGDDSLFGGKGADTIWGGDGNDSLEGDGGIDRINGGFGFDLMSGGYGGDVFVWTGTAQTGLGAAADVILDFSPNVQGNSPPDKIDVSAIDATGSTAFNGTFNFIGFAEFTAEGQIRLVQGSDRTIVQFNTLGASVAEMEIQLYHCAANTIVEACFIL